MTDKEAIEALEKRGYRMIADTKSPGRRVRIWERKTK